MKTLDDDMWWLCGEVILPGKDAVHTPPRARVKLGKATLAWIALRYGLI